MSVPPNLTKLERHEILKQKLQDLYGGEAYKYDPTNGGNMFPPHGMCPVDAFIKIVDSYRSKLHEADRTIARLEADLNTKYPYIPGSPHPMIVLKPNIPVNDRRASAENSARIEIYNQVGRAVAEKLQAEEHLAFWTKHVKPVDHVYMAEIQTQFYEKAQLRKDLLCNEGLSVEPW